MNDDDDDDDNMTICTAMNNRHTDRQTDRQLIITYIVRFGDCEGQNAPNRLRVSSPQTTLGEFTMGDRLSAVFQQQFSAFFTCVQVFILRLASLYFLG